MAIAIPSFLLTSILGEKTVSSLSINAKNELNSYISGAVSEFLSLLGKGNLSAAFTYAKQAESKFFSLVHSDVEKSGPRDIEAVSTLAIDENHTGAVGKLVAENGWDTQLSKVTWSVAGGKDAADFSISKDGVLSAVSPFNYEAQHSATVIVKATDDFGRVYTKTLSVKIGDVNEAPTNVTLDKSSTTLSETSKPGTVVGTFHTTDPDAGDKFTYKISGSDYFTVKDSSLVTTKLVGSGDYTVNVTSTDQGGLSVTKAVSVHVDGKHPVPTDITLSSTHISENKDAGSVVGTLGVVDTAVGETFKYTITGGPDAADFAVNGTSLVTTHPFDYEATPSKQVDITVTDHLGYSYSKVVNVSVDNVNEAPYGLSFIQNGSVYSNAPVSSLVGTLHASDPDKGDVLSYSLSGKDASFFHTDTAGDILISSAIGWNGGVAREFDATVTDLGGLTDTQHYSVRAQGVAPADIGVSSTAVSDGVKAGTSVSSFTAVGEDPTDPVTWQISGPDAAKFTLNGSSLVATSDINYAQSGNALHLTVKATEADGASYSKDITLSVSPPDDTGTGLTGLRLSDYGVSEGLPGNHTVATILEDGATTPVTLSIVGGTNADHFTLQDNHLVLINTETSYLTPTLDVVVQGTDASGHTVTQAFDVNVLPAAYTAGSGDVFNTPGVDVFLPDPSTGGMTIHGMSEQEHDQIDMLFLFTQDQINTSTVRLTGTDDLNVHVQANTGSGWSDVAVLNGAKSADGTLNGDAVADPLTQAQLDALTQSWIANNTIHA